MCQAASLLRQISILTRAQPFTRVTALLVQDLARKFNVLTLVDLAVYFPKQMSSYSHVFAEHMHESLELFNGRIHCMSNDLETWLKVIKHMQVDIFSFLFICVY